MAINFSIFITRSTTDSNAPPFSGVAVSSTNTYYSDTISGNDADGMGLTLLWTGTPTGVFTMWMTDNQAPSLADDTDWVQDTTWAPTNPAGSGSKFRDDTGNAKAMRKRIKYVNASGTGVIKGWVTVPKMA